MSKLNFTFSSTSITKSQAFTEASREELRVLVALLERCGRLDSMEELCRISATSKARCAAALTLWEEEGIIEKVLIPKEEESTIVEEFEERVRLGELHRSPAKEAARTIRDDNLAAMIEECATIMHRPAFSTEEVKELEAIYSRLALSAEYVTSLAAHLAQTNDRVTPTALAKKAEELCHKGITSFEDLDSYIKMVEAETATDKEIKRALSIRGRALVPGELEYFHKWSGEFGYSVEIIKEAYNKAVMKTGERSLAYMDTLLTAWHTAGCKTVSECIENSEAFSVEHKQKKARQKQKSEPATPKYGNFDVEDAFAKALARSYGEDK